MSKDDELSPVRQETPQSEEWENDAEWEEWDDEEQGRRRLGRTVPGWVPLLVIAGLVVVIGFRWGFSGRATPRPTPTMHSPGIGQPSQSTISPGLTLPAFTPGATTPIPLTGERQGTSIPIAVGKTVVVAGAGSDGISLRFGGGLDYARLTILTDGTVLTVLEPPADLQVPYPVQNNGFTWWRVQMQDGTVGWVAENWLQVVE